jgi:hypothetical protein
MQVALICRTLSPTELAELVNSPIKLFRQPAVGAQGLDATEFELSPERKDQLARESFDAVLAYGDRLIDGQTVAQHLAYGKSSDWYLHRFRIYFEQRAIIYLQEEIRQLAREHESVRVYHALDGLSTEAPNVDLRFQAVQSRRVGMGSLANYAIAFSFRVLEGFVQSLKARQRKHVVLYRPVQEHDLLALDGKTMIKDDFLLGYMLQEAPTEFLLVEEFNTPRIGTPFKLRRRHFGGRPKGRRYLNGEHIIFRALVNPRVRRRRRAIVENIHAALDLIGRHDAEPVHMRITHRLRGLDRTRRLFILRKLAYARYFRNWNGLTATGTDENNAFTKPMLDAFKELGITTIGVQHGTMSDLHPSFRFTKADLLLHPMPDKTIVWGDAWKHGLVEEGNYLPDSVVVCGQQRTDLIPTLRSTRKSELMPGLIDEKPVLVFASQPQPDEALRHRAAFDVFKLTQRFPDLQVVVKLHPRERDERNYYEAIARQAGSTRHRIVSRVDLYQLISICDMLVTCFSTVGSETVYFRKPLVVLDYLKQDLLGYVKRGVAFHATTGTELEGTVIRILDGQRCADSEIDRYIRDFAFRIDGRSRFRYLEVILGMSRKQRQEP